MVCSVSTMGISGITKVSDQKENITFHTMYGDVTKKKAEVIFALEDGVEVGFALFFHNFSTFLGRAGIYLEDLYVSPQYRGKGYGKGLLRKLAQIAVERGCGRLDWSCLDWNKPGIDFYLSLGAEPLDQWTVYRLTGDTLHNMAKE